MRVILFFLLVLFVFHSSIEFAHARRSKNLTPDPKKYAAYMVHADTGIVLYEKNADLPRHPASLVKLMTLYITFEAVQSGKLKMGQYLPVSAKAAAQESLNLKLRRGQKIRVRDAIYALVVRSANDAAVVLAEAIAGSEKRFAEMMTKKAKDIGMYNTTFKNASGLYHKQQLSTAKDLATLMITLQRDFSKYASYFRRSQFFYNGVRYKTHNRLLKSYKGSYAGKTGYIRAAGFNLVSSAKRRGHELIGVVLGGKTSKSRDKIMVGLLDNGFKKLRFTSRNKIKAIASVPTPMKKPWNEPILVASADTFGGKKVWSIELGSFDAEYQAINAVTNAMDAAPDQLAYSQINFINRNIDGQESHWAKFIRLTEEQAKKACNALIAVDTICKVVDD